MTTTPTTTTTTKTRVPQYTHCVECGAELTHAATGRPKMVCSEACRNMRVRKLLAHDVRARERRLRALLREAMQLIAAQTHTAVRLTGRTKEP